MEQITHTKQFHILILSHIKKNKVRLSDEKILALLFIVFSVVFVYLIVVLYFVSVLVVYVPSSESSE